MESIRHRDIEIVNTTFAVTFSVEGLVYRIHKIDHIGKTNHKILGSFSVNQTIPNNILDINFYVLTLQQFIEWVTKSRGIYMLPNQPLIIYQKVSKENFKLEIGRSEDVCFVFDNRYSFNTPKQISTSIHEEWDEGVNPKLDVITTVPPSDRGLSNDVNRIIFIAKNNLKIMTPYIDMTVLDLILSKVRSGVEVKIITRTRKEVEGKDKKATFDHIRNELDRNHKVSEFLHSRVIIRDEVEALLSSADLTHDSLVSQFNAGILSSDPKVVEKLLDYFNLVWTKAKDAS